MTDPHLCGGCKHWRPLTDHDAESRRLQPSGYGSCGRVKMLGDVFSDVAIVEDGSWQYAALLSRADFGCVLFEPAGRPEANP